MTTNELSQRSPVVRSLGKLTYLEIKQHTSKYHRDQKGNHRENFKKYFELDENENTMYQIL